VKRARDFVGSALAELDLPDAVPDAILVVSELVTNAIVHAGTDITVRVRSVDSDVRVEVEDGSSALPELRILSSGASAGRGLLLVEHFTKQWGAEATPSGKVVWFVVEQED
jgi:anti-sigma regulatory factor (Ser/Thr protein kinase)